MRFIWGHKLVHLLSPADTSSDGLHIYLTLLSAALPGLGQSGGVSSHNWIPNLWRVWNLPIGFYFIFTRFSLTPWILAFSGFSEGLALMGPFRRFNISDVFGGCSKIVWFNLWSFPRDLACLVHLFSWISPLLLSGCYFSNRYCLEVLAEFFSFFSGLSIL